MIYGFFTLFGYCAPGGGGGNGLVHKTLLQVFSSDAPNIEVFETDFFDTVIT